MAMYFGAGTAARVAYATLWRGRATRTADAQRHFAPKPGVQGDPEPGRGAASEVRGHARDHGTPVTRLRLPHYLDRGVPREPVAGF